MVGEACGPADSVVAASAVVVSAADVSAAFVVADVDDVRQVPDQQD